MLEHPRCPVTGLFVLERPEWTYVDTDANYRLSIRVIGGRILHARVAGRVTLGPLKHAVDLVRQVADENFGLETPYVQIEDYLGLEGSNTESRKYFIQEITSRPNIGGLICCNTSAFFRVNIRLAMKLTKYHFPVRVTETLPEALTLAAEILSLDTAVARSQAGQQQCPVSGLAIRRPSHWTGIDLGNNLQATFEMIGDDILLSRCRGNPETHRHCQSAFYKARRKVLDEALPPDAPFFEIRDFSPHTGGFPLWAWRRYLRTMTADNGKLLGFVGYNASARLHLELATWQKIQKASFFTGMEKDYRKALAQAMKALALHRRGRRLADLTRIRHPEWDYSSGTLSLRMEVLDDRILHMEAWGTYTLGDVQPAQNRIQDAVTAMLEKTAGDGYLVIGLRGLRSFGGASRRRLFEMLQNQMRKSRLIEMILFYGANAAARAAIHLNQPLMAMNTRLVDDLAEAIDIICKEQQKPDGIEKNKDRSMPSVPETGEKGDARHHIDEMLHFLGSINWEKDGPVPMPPTLGKSHPLEQVYEAISLIKADLDELLLERKKAEKERLRLATTLEQSTEGIIITDATGAIQYANPAFEQASGYAKEEVLGLGLEQVMADPEREDLLKGMWEIVRQGSVWRQRMASRKKDGTLYQTDVTISPVFAEDGNIFSFAVAQRDITHELKLEAQLRQRLKMEAIGTLAGGIAHDFNNLLYPIIGFAEMTLDHLPPESEGAENQQEILKAAERAKHLVDQILTFSRKEEPKKQPVQIDSVLNEAIRLLRAFLPATIEIHQQITDESMTLMADPTQLHQVILNLGTNAGHAIGRSNGNIVFVLESVMLTESDMPPQVRLDPGGYARLRVLDSGCGVDPDIADRIFDPFFTTKPPGDGTGMGLALVHGIVTNHGGAIAMESRPPRGTAVDVYLPLAQGSGPDAHAIPEAGSVPRGTRVLLVDDEAQIIRMTTQMLKQMGCRVSAHTSATQALEAFRQDPDGFDLLITDLTMPAMTGEALARAVGDIRPGLPIIICSGFLNIRPDQRLTGRCQILTKPVFRSDLNRAIGRALKDRRERTPPMASGSKSE